MLLRSRLYAGIVDVPDYGVRAKRGDFEPLISEDLFYRVRALLRILWAGTHRWLVERASHRSPEVPLREGATGP